VAEPVGLAAMTVLGYGAANVGNLYSELSDEQAWEVLDAVWESGVRYFDTAPHYGLGLSERRLGAFLRTKPRSDFVVSTKVGRLLVPQDNPHDAMDTEADFHVRADRRRQWDFSAAGIERSLEESLTRLGLDAVDVIYLHDPERYDLDRALETGLAGARALRDAGMVRAIGVGSMSTPALEAAVAAGNIDLLMVAGRWTLLDRAGATLMDNCAERGIGVVLASVLNSGLLADTEIGPAARYEYGAVPPAIRRRHHELVVLCGKYGIELPAAALQFGRQHPATRSVVVGTARADQFRADAKWFSAVIPDGFWAEIFAADAHLPRPF
jgi:D-threo-aldose 1-dehydrogenase